MQCLEMSHPITTYFSSIYNNVLERNGNAIKNSLKKQKRDRMKLIVYFKDDLMTFYGISSSVMAYE